MSSSGVVRRGVVAGLLAATAVAVFFFLLDLIQEDMLRTPRFLAGLLSGGAAGFGAIALYTLLHYVSYTGIGVAVAWAFGRSGLRPAPLLGLVLGVLLFDLLFYAGIVLRGVDVVDRLGWPALLAGSVVGGLVLIGYLRATAPQPRTTLRALLASHRTVREGLIAGLLGAAAVALWFLVVDMIVRDPFFTPAALGSALLDGARGIGEVDISLANVLGYSALHLAAFVLVGILAAALAAEAERHGIVLLGAVLLFVTFETLFLGLAAIAATWLLDALTWWNILLANLIAAAAMGWYLWRAHPRLRDRLREDLEEDQFTGTERPDVGGARPPVTR